MSYYIFKFKMGDTEFQTETLDSDLVSREFEKSAFEAFGLPCNKSPRQLYRKPPVTSASDFRKNQTQHVQPRRQVGSTDYAEKQKSSDTVSKEFEAFLQKGQPKENTTETKVEIQPVEAKAELFQKNEINDKEVQISETQVVSLNESINSISDNESKSFADSLADFKATSRDELFISDPVAEEKEIGVEKTILNVSQNIENVDSVSVSEFTLEESAAEVNIEEAKIVEQIIPTEVQQQEPPASFSDVLQMKFETIPDEIIENNNESGITSSSDNVNSFDEFLSVKNPKTMLDHLLLAAYYMQNFESLEKYSLKHLNLKVIPATKVPVNHAVVLEAVSLNYIEVVPDNTGTSYVTEYRITEDGAKYVTNEL